MKKNKGFTLIELLVVIAIIGILASVVLASLTSARIKGKVAALESTMSSMRAAAEIGVANGRYVKDICSTPSAGGGIGTLLASIQLASSKATNISCGQDTGSGVAPFKWAVQAELPVTSSTPTGTYFCVDSTGFSGPVVGSKLTVGAAPNGYSSSDLVCSS